MDNLVLNFNDNLGYMTSPFLGCHRNC